MMTESLRAGMLAGVVRRMAKVLINVYDVIIVVPLMVEHLVVRRMAAIDADDSAHQAR